MPQSDAFDQQVPRKRLRSLIDHDSIDQHRQETSQAFRQVVELYVSSLTICPLRSFLARDEENPDSKRHWTPDTAIILADVELAIESALYYEKELLNFFWRWFVQPELEPVRDEKLTLEEKRLHGQIIQRCGKEFLRRGLYPFHRYFKMPKHPSKRTQ